MTDGTDLTKTSRPTPATEGARLGRPPSAHPGELTLRRLLASELVGDARDATTTHLGGCADCARRLDALRAEQRAFEERISFDRFAVGVERAARVPAPGAAAKIRWWARPTSTRSFVTLFSLGAVASVAALVITALPSFEFARLRSAANVERGGPNRIKGDGRAAVTMRIAGPDDGPQRATVAAGPTAAPEPLRPGERIRIGVRPGERHYVFVISIDDQGVVTPVYPEVGTSLPLPPGGELQYLPDSVELTGNGLERLVVLLTDEPMELDSVRHAVANGLRQAGGSLLRLPDLAVEGEQFHRTFLKP
jgi:hypothetical protein